MKDSFQINEISPKDTLELRQRILRPHQTMEDCVYPGDEDSTTFHLGAFENGNLMGIVSIYQRNHDSIDGQKGFQIRAMAAEKGVRGKGLARALLTYAERKIRSLYGDYIWANARVSALGFYDKLDYSVIGEPFNVDDIGMHNLIIKRY